MRSEREEEMRETVRKREENPGEREKRERERERKGRRRDCTYFSHSFIDLLFM